MKSIKIIAANFKSGILHNIIMIVFVALSVFFMNLSLSEFMHQEYINNYVRECGLYEDYMYLTFPDKSAFNDHDKRREIWAKELSLLDKLKSDGIIENWYLSTTVSSPITDKQNSDGEYTDRAKIYSYPRELASDLHFPVSNGIWFDKYDFTDDITPVVVGSDLKQRFKPGAEFSIFNSDKKYLVIGVLERNAMLLSQGAGGNGMDLNGVFNIANNAIIEAVDEIEEPLYSNSALIKPVRGNSGEVFRALGDISYIFTFAELAQRAYEDNRFLTEMQTTLFVLMMAVCIAGVSSGNLLSAISHKKRYAVYFMCGMEWSSALLITFAEDVIKLLLPAVLGYGMFMDWCVKRDYWQLRVTSVNVAVTIAFLAGIFLLTSLLPLLDIKRTSPVKIIAET